MTAPNGILESNANCQIGMVVRDIDATAKAYSALLGVPVPPTILTDSLDKAHTQFKGKPTEARAKLAFFQLGSISLELIEPIGGPSTWKEHLDDKGEGVHHIAFGVKGMDNVIDRLGKTGIPLIQKGDYSGGRYAYTDGLENLKVIIELLENF